MDKDLMRKEVSSLGGPVLTCSVVAAHSSSVQSLGNFGLDNAVDAAQVSQAAQEQEKEKIKYRQGWVAGTDFRRIREARKAAEQSAEAAKTRDA